ncbi:hypothetical protein [Occultella kanbiaonis]|uniref:hypothetical protein n=1 Tax=Occultella kanbiaonis TaxID=2675754 RepID=UPI0012B7A998|nr:hypothetical protein [Occultella kanbiaonis]
MSSISTSTARRRVSAEHRWLGLDKRSFPYAIFVIVVFLIATVAIPRINNAIEWDDPVQAGEQLALSDTIAFTPVTGWNVESGFRVGEGGSAVASGEATIAGDGVTFDIVPDTFSGTPAELLAQIEKVTSRTGDPTFRVEGEPITITTSAGDVGVAQTYSSVRGDGLVAAFVLDGTGLKITAFGPPTQMRAAAENINAMIASIRTTGAETDGGAG